MNKVTLISKAQACLMGVAIGDALGMPVETMSHEKIMDNTGGKGIEGFVDPVSRKEWQKDLKAGDTTDDWQLTRTVAKSLIRTEGVFDVTDCAREHVAELRKSTFGWGKTTQLAIEAIRDGKRVVGKDKLPLPEQGKGCGNGIIMKVAPLAIAEFALWGSEGTLWRSVSALGSITHPDIRASISAYAVALALHGILRNQFYYNEFIRVIEAVEEVEAASDVSAYRVSSVLKKTALSLESVDALRKAVGCGFYATETAAFTLGIYLRYKHRSTLDFREGVLEAVNAGGDTDTNASIVGALIGADLGIEGIPEEWRNYNPGFAEALDLGQKLCF